MAHALAGSRRAGLARHRCGVAVLAILALAAGTARLPAPVVGALALLGLGVTAGVWWARGLARELAAREAGEAACTRELEARRRELAEARDQQAATAEILSVISGSPTDVGPVFATIVDKAMGLVDAHLGALFRYEGDEVFRAVEARGAGPELRAMWGQPQRLPRPFFRANGPWKPAQILDVRETEQYRRREPLWVNNADQEGMRTLLTPIGE